MDKKQTDPGMHTAEHLVNQAMARMFHCGRTFSTHLEKKKSKVDFHFDRPLLDTEEEELQKRINDAIDADMPVFEEFVSRDDAARDFNLTRLPEDAGDRIRIIRIGDYDACPCIGEHVKSTGEIGRFILVSTSFDAGVLRIRFKLSNS
ncbi:MAG: hypothetical protein LLG06_16590 [Desulfobacteraceae bacterium]|nr:hypothetical protein [Desulfobacteraceae bacterium]